MNCYCWADFYNGNKFICDQRIVAYTFEEAEKHVLKYHPDAATEAMVWIEGVGCNKIKLQ